MTDMRLPAALILICAVWLIATDADAQSSPVVGPKLVCFKYSSFSLAEGETITDFQGGAEAMAVQVDTPVGAFQIAESEIFATPARLGRVLFRRDVARVYRIRRPELRYAITGPTSYSDGERELVIWLSGPALSGRGADADLYRRFRVADPTGLPCDYTFTYGWEFMLGLD